MAASGAPDGAPPVSDLQGHTRAVKCVQMHPTASGVMVSASMDDTVKLWNLETGRLREREREREREEI
jgi:WD40 repeat protein